MLTTLTKKVSRQQLYIHGHFTREELYYLRKEGWRVEWRDKPAPKAVPVKKKTRSIQRNKNGIPVGRVV